MNQAPLVSLLIPAYNAQFFGHALKSALLQTYPHLEIIVSDDAPDSAIGDLVRRQQDERVRYVKNEQNLGFSGNFTQCFELARGTFIKFLNDDDMLHPECVARMVEAFQRYGPQVTLLTSKRQVINEKGEPIGDLPATRALSGSDGRIRGKTLMNFVLQESLNLIGEPSTIMFRKADLDFMPGNIFRIGQQDYQCLADMSLQLRLLEKGDAVYLAMPLSAYRLHSGQYQNQIDVALSSLTDRFELVQEAEKRGFLGSPEMRQKTYRLLLELVHRFQQAERFEAFRPTLNQIQAAVTVKLQDLSAEPT